MKAPIDGGSPQLVKASALPNGFMNGAVNFSPDGKLMPEFMSTPDPATPQTSTTEIAFVDVTANAETPAKTFIPRAGFAASIAVAPDGKSVAYTVVENGVGNIWSQTFDGSPGHRLTNFTSDQIGSFQFSPDGKTLGVVRVRVVSDVVLLRDTRTASQ